MSRAAPAQRERFERLRELHHGPGVLVLPNAWDVASAVVMARVPGCRAVASSSAGVAGVLGYPDGERIRAREMLDMVARIAQAVEIPVTADVESGYSDSPETVLDFAAELADGGIAGINLEDANGPVERHVAKIEAIRD